MCSSEVSIVAPRLLLDAIPDLSESADSAGTDEIARNADGDVVVHVDACIAPAVLALWNAGIVTLSSCCGHVQPGDDHPWGVITIQTKAGVNQRGAQLVRRDEYETLLAAQARADRLAAENAALIDYYEKVTGQRWEPLAGPAGAGE